MEIDLKISFDTTGRGEYVRLAGFRAVAGRIRQRAAETEAFGDVTAEVGAALECGLSLAAQAIVCDTLLQLAINRAAGQKRAVLALRDRIGLHVSTGEEAEFYLAVGRLVNECRGEWRGDAGALSQALARHGVNMNPRAAARRIWLEEVSLTLGGYRVVRQLREGHFYYTIRKAWPGELEQEAPNGRA